MSEPSADENTVVVDVHEPDKIRMLLLSHPDVDNWLEESLDAADIVVNGVGFERKTPSDFAQSILDNRIDEQIRKLTEAYEHSVILIEGGFDGFSSLDHTSLTPQSARGKAASIHMRWGIPVVPTGGTAGTETAKRLLVDYATRLGRKSTEEPSSAYLEGSVVGQDEPLGKRLWGCFEGVGATRADDLWMAVGSPVQGPLSPNELEAIDGIGAKTAESLVNQMQPMEDQSQ